MLRNASSSLIGNILSIPLQFLGFIIVARSLGPAAFGQYSFAQELTLFVVYAADAGLNVIATREMARHRENAGAIHGTLLRLKLYLSLICYLVILAVGAALSDSLATFAALAVLGVANLLLSYLFLANGVFRACERMVWESVTGLLQPICFCLFTAFVAYSSLVPDGLLPMTLARLLSFLPVVALALFVSWRLVPPRRAPAPSSGLEYLRQGLPIFMAMFVFDALLRISVLFLQAWSTSVELSMFTVSSRIVYSLWLIPYILSGAWLPGMAMSVAQGQAEQFGQHALRLIRLLLIMAVPMAMVLHLASEPIILLLFGRDYQGAIACLRILANSVPFLFLFYGMKTILEAKHHQKLFYFIVTTGLFVGLLANAWLVRTNGAEGAAWAYFAGLSSSTCLGYLFAGKALCWSTLARSATRVACGTVVAGFALVLLLPVSFLLALAVSGVVYLSVLLLLGEINSRTLL
ncbi:MAG: oligosaccharide flippase family protein [Proteobacteria bacterium]|nr:oligosaccharide flippase family protein [Pseudomonadota bacterium]